MKREIVTLYGRVQGIGFRERVIEVAGRHRVAGTVRNLAAGRALEIDVEGDDAAVDAFIDDVVARRPMFARIQNLDRRRVEPQGFRGFERAPTA